MDKLGVFHENHQLRLSNKSYIYRPKQQNLHTLPSPMTKMATKSIYMLNPFKNLYRWKLTYPNISLKALKLLKIQHFLSK